MIIGIDITMLVYAGSGVANYIFNLTKNLLIIDKKNEYRLFYSSLRRPKNFYYLEELKKLGGKVYSFRMPPSLLQLFWEKNHIIPVELFIGKVDVFFSSDFLKPPLFKGTKGVTTIHDLTWKLFPQYHETRIINAHENKLAKTIKHKDEIVVDSISTKKDLLKLYPQIDKNQVHIVYLGISDHFKPILDKKKIAAILKKYNVFTGNPYLLYVGAVEPRKNLVRSVEVFSELIKDRKFTNYKFLIVGRAGWRKEAVYATVKKLGLTDKVIFVGFVEDDDLPYFYSGAKLTVYLSSYEGFGLPPLESLACGTKVIAGDNSSQVETIDKQFLVNVDDSKKILEKMKSLLLSNIRVDATAIQKKYSWESSAREFLKIISS